MNPSFVRIAVVLAVVLCWHFYKKDRTTLANENNKEHLKNHVRKVPMHENGSAQQNQTSIPAKNITGYFSPSSVRKSKNTSSATANESSPDDSEPTTSKNKTLVVLMGDLRCGEPCWKSLRENVLQVHKADLALLIQPPQPQYQNSSLLDIAKYHWPVPVYDNWLDALDVIMNNSSVWQKTFFDQVLPIYHEKNILLGPIKYNSTQKFRGSAMIIFYKRYLLSQRIKQFKLHQQYDWFVVTRTDHYNKCPHANISSMNPQSIYIPRGENYLGICDRHMVVSKHQVLRALDIVPPLLRNPLQYRDVLDSEAGNSEMFLERRFMEMGLDVPCSLGP
mmetsp:Transcript_22079/g.46038  ORF Transcript_22079/g.46038 Transcript_22079/m.46038 type:complete len:334 (-) Transcript_22079:298-1299(-)